MEDLWFEVGSIELVGLVFMEILLGIFEFFYELLEVVECYVSVFWFFVGVVNLVFLFKDVIFVFLVRDLCLFYFLK